MKVSVAMANGLGFLKRDSIICNEPNRLQLVAANVAASAILAPAATSPVLSPDSWPVVLHFEQYREHYVFQSVLPRTLAR